MDIQFYGANCVVLSSRNTRVVVDDNLKSLGSKSVSKEGDIAVFTSEHELVTSKPKIVVDMPGEYEASNVSMFGIQARAHMDEQGKKSAVMYRIDWGDTKVLVTGHVFPKLSEADLERIGLVDIMIVPVGGSGFTLDATGAMQLIKQVEPKVVIPTHYADASLHYEVPQSELSDALQSLGMDHKEAVAKYQFKPADVTDTTQVVVLETTN